MAEILNPTFEGSRRLERKKKKMMFSSHKRGRSGNPEVNKVSYK